MDEKELKLREYWNNLKPFKDEKNKRTLSGNRYWG